MIGAVALAAMAATSPAPAAPAVRGGQLTAATTVEVDWPSAPLAWNEPAWVTATVRPAQAGRVVRLGLWGMGGPGWSRIDAGRTDASGTVRLRLLTMCVDGECTTATERYRVVVPPTPIAGRAVSKGTIRLEW